MTNETHLSELGADWRRQSVDLDRLRKLTERRSLRLRLTLAAKAAGTGIALGSGLWFCWLSLTGAPAIFALAGVVLLLALPVMVFELVGKLRALRIGGDDTPAGVLRKARDQAAAELHLLWGSRAAALILLGSAAGLLALHAAGQAGAEDALFFAPLWGVFALGIWLWQRHRGRRLAAEISRCRSLLWELEASDEIEAGEDV